MKKIFFSILLFFSSQAISETYVCSPSALSMIKIERDGDIFKQSLPGFEKYALTFEIARESKSSLVLLRVSEGSENTKEKASLIFIDKEKGDYGMLYVGMEEFRDPDDKRYDYGRCVVVN